MNRKKISNFLIENRWIVIASIFFVLWKFLLVSVLWDHRLSPPKPDDSFVYVTHIENIRQCPSVFFCKETIIPRNHPLFFSHLVYGAFFGTLANILRVSSAQVYHLSFYLGTLALLPALIFFLKSLTKDKRLVAFSLFFLALYNGGGSYHGFFWVVPSFFALLFFFLIFSFLNDEHKRWKVPLLILIPAAIYTHMLALYLIFTLFIFVILKFLATKKIDRLLLKKILFVLLVTVVVYFSLSLYFGGKSFSGNQYGIETTVKNLSKNISSAKNTASSKQATGDPPKIVQTEIKSSFSFRVEHKFQAFFSKNSFKRIEDNYFKWVFLNLFGFASFILILILLARYRQIDVLLLFSSALIFVIVSIPFQYGYRSLILLWPITFLLYAFGSWHALKFVREKTKDRRYSIVLKILIVLAISIFTLVNLIYSYNWNKFSNREANFNIDMEYARYIKKNLKKGTQLMYGSKLLDSIDDLNGLRNISRTNKIEEASYFVSLANAGKKYSNSSLDKFLEYFSRATGVSRKKTPANTPAQDQYLKDNFSLAEKFGDIEIYKRN